MKIVDADTLIEIDCEEVEVRYLAQLMKAAERGDLAHAQRFYQETTKPPGTPMPDMYSRLTKQGFQRNPNLKGTSTGKIRSMHLTFHILHGPNQEVTNDE